MKIVCLVSSGKGHLDFGGKGFIKLVQELSKLGHEILFLSDPKQKEVIEKLNFAFKEVHKIDRLWLNNYDKEKNISFEYMCALKMIESKVIKEKPDLILVDRILGLAEGFFNLHQIPYISIGTPGGIWAKNENGIIPSRKENKYLELQKNLAKKINWKFNEISAWCNSPLMNICFVGKEFYDHGISNTSVFIDIPFETSPSIKKNKIGLSLGSGTIDLDKVVEYIESSSFATDNKLIIFGKIDWWNKLKAKLSQELLKKVDYQSFINFESDLTDFSELVFAGGISTIWYCNKYNIKPTIIPSGYNDQMYNSNRVAAINISTVDFTFSNTIQEIAKKMSNLF